MFSSLSLVFAVERRPGRDFVRAACGFVLGCGAVVLSLGWLGPRTTYDQGPVVFHTAWYGEASRSNVLQTENAFQVARDDNLTLYQANYFAHQRYGADEPVLRRPNDAGHLRRVQAMYGELARLNAFSWWRAFPSFMVRSLGVDRPTVLASVVDAEFFYSGNEGLWAAWERSLEWYGVLVPWLAGLGAVLGLLHPRTRVWTVIFGGLFFYHAVALMLVLPEPKHHPPLLLPLHVLAAIGLGSMVRLAVGWRRLDDARRLVRGQGRPPGGGRSRRPLVAVCRSGGDGPCRPASSSRIVQDILRPRLPARTSRARGRARSCSPSRWMRARLRHRRAISSRSAPSKEVDLLCVHQRSRTDGSAFLAYYTRHRILPGQDRLFFFNVIAGATVGMIGRTRRGFGSSVPLSWFRLGDSTCRGGVSACP